MYNEVRRGTSVRRATRIEQKDEPELALDDSVSRVNQVCKKLGLVAFASWLSQDELLCFSEDILQDRFGDDDCARLVQRVIWQECRQGGPPASIGGVLRSALPMPGRQEVRVADVLLTERDAGRFSDDDFADDDFEETYSWPSEELSGEPSEVRWGVGLPDFDSLDSETREDSLNRKVSSSTCRNM